MAIASAVLLVTDVLSDRTQAWLTAGAVAAPLACRWIGVPSWRRRHNEQENRQDAPGSDHRVA